MHRRRTRSRRRETPLDLILPEQGDNVQRKPSSFASVSCRRHPYIVVIISLLLLFTGVIVFPRLDLGILVYRILAIPSPDKGTTKCFRNTRGRIGYQKYNGNGTASSISKRQTSIPLLQQVVSQNLAAVHQNVLTVAVSTFRQPTCLKKAVKYMRTCKVVKEIRINWFEAALAKPPSDVDEWFSVSDQDPSTLASVTFDILPNNLTHRFWPHRDWATDAIFHVDVDTVYTCDALAFAYQSWIHSEDPQTTAVGFHGRYLRGPGRMYAWSESFKDPLYRYNTIFVTKGGIVPRQVLESYHEDPEYACFRAAADEKITGEDMLMSFVMARMNIQVISLCLEPEQTCKWECMKHGLDSLNHRTDKARGGLLDAMFEVWGTEMLNNDIQTGSDHVVWQDAEQGPERNWCFSEPNFGRSKAWSASFCQ